MSEATFDDFGTFDAVQLPPVGGTGAARFIAKFRTLGTVANPGTETDDEYGNDDAAYADEWTGFVKIWRAGAREVTEGRATQVGDHLVDLVPDAWGHFNGNSRLTVAGVTYEADGPPSLVTTPRGPSHVTGKLTVVTGG